MVNRRAWVWIVFAICLTGSARAVPPDRVIWLEPGTDRFEKGPPGKWEIKSSDENVVRAEYFETAEVHLQAAAVGQAVLLLLNRSIEQLEVWKVRVGLKAAEPLMPDRPERKGVCSCKQVSGNHLSCEVADEPCLRSLAEWLRNVDLTVPDVEVRYTIPGLQALLRRIRSRLDQTAFKEIEVAFVGANLRLTGSVPDEKRFQELILSVYEAMVGKLVIEDRVNRVSKGR